MLDCGRSTPCSKRHGWVHVRTKKHLDRGRSDETVIAIVQVGGGSNAHEVRRRRRMRLTTMTRSIGRCGHGGACRRQGRVPRWGRRRDRMMHPGEDIDLLVLLIEQVLELAHLGLERPDPLLEGLGVATRKGASAELVAGAALEPHRGALRACRAHSVTADLLASTTIARLRDAALRSRPDLDDLHGQDARHDETTGRFRQGVDDGPSSRPERHTSPLQQRLGFDIALGSTAPVRMRSRNGPGPDPSIAQA